MVFYANNKKYAVDMQYQYVATNTSSIQLGVETLGLIQPYRFEFEQLPIAK